MKLNFDMCCTKFDQNNARFRKTLARSVWRTKKKIWEKITPIRHGRMKGKNILSTVLRASNYILSMWPQILQAKVWFPRAPLIYLTIFTPFAKDLASFWQHKSWQHLVTWACFGSFSNSLRSPIPIFVNYVLIPSTRETKLMNIDVKFGTALLRAEIFLNFSHINWDFLKICSRAHWCRVGGSNLFNKYTLLTVGRT